MNKMILLALLILLSGCGKHTNKGKNLAEIQALRERADSLAEAARWKHTELRAGEGVFQVLQRLGLDNGTALRFSNELSYKVELANLKAGEEFAARFDPDTSDTGSLVEFRYQPYLVISHRLLVDTADGSLHYICLELPTEKRYRMIKGFLKAGSSLNQSLLDAALPGNITQTVNGILMCKISFRTDARENDSFAVLLQEEYYKDRIVPERTRVLHVSYQGKRTGSHETYLYREPNDPKSSYNAHYTPEGEALIHTGLRYPLDRLHISSRYGWRIHPITGRRAMHYGVDYTGSIGTPVYAVAAGPGCAFGI